MATYAVGDIQGCRAELERLLEKIDFRPGRDALWVAGDAVNRGPDSLGVLRLLHELRGSTTCVLGNHDLHLLRAARGGRGVRRSPDLMAVVEAPDAGGLLEWVRGWKFIHAARVPRGGGGETEYLMVHAGVPADRSAARLLELDRTLRKSRIGSWWGANRGIVKFLTQVRFVSADGQPDYSCREAPRSPRVPAHLMPWFSLRLRALKGDREILFGHWAATGGESGADRVHALDAACVWGGRLKAMRLEDQAVFSVPAGR